MVLNKVAVVTGAGTGIGKAVALALLREGYAVVLAGRRKELLEAAAREGESAGSPALVVPTDVADPAAVRALFARTKEAFGRLDVLVNNAGVMVRGDFLQVPVDAYREMFEVNVAGTMLCTRHALPAMIQRRYGRIVNLSSQLARLGAIGRIGFAAYSATKGAIESFTRGIAHEFGHHVEMVGVQSVHAAAPPTRPSWSSAEYARRRPPADLATDQEPGRAADRLGYDQLWVPEMAKADSPAMAGIIACRTNRIELVLGPLAVTVRSPVQIAMALQTVAATGRPVHVALGTSSDTVARWHRRSRSGAVDALARALGDVRALLAGDRVDGFRLSQPPAPQPTITVAAFGPKAVAVAAGADDHRAGDGLGGVVGEGCPVLGREVALPCVGIADHQRPQVVPQRGALRLVRERRQGAANRLALHPEALGQAHHLLGLQRPVGELEPELARRARGHLKGASVP